MMVTVTNLDRDAPPADDWIKGLWVRYADGTTAPLQGLVVLPGQTIIGELRKFCIQNNADIFEGPPE